MKAGILILFLCSMVFLIGCGSPLVKPKITDSRTFDAAYDDVWRAVVQAFAERSLPVSTLEKDSGFITTQSHIIDYGLFSETTLEAIAVHPNIAFGVWENPKLSVNGFVSTEGGNITRVKINTHIEAYEKNMFGKWYICYSKGIIEKDILNTIQSKLGQMPQGTSIGQNVPQKKIVGYRVDTSRKGPDGQFLRVPVYEDEKN